LPAAVVILEQPVAEVLDHFRDRQGCGLAARSVRSGGLNGEPAWRKGGVLALGRDGREVLDLAAVALPVVCIGAGD
jgi:hypothetical protein